MSDIVIIGTKLIMDGFIYYRGISTTKRSYWECKRYRSGRCKARAITENKLTADLTIFKRPSLSNHEHAPNQHDCQAEIAKYSMMEAAQAGRPPSAILREKMPTLSKGVLSHLPDRENLKKPMRRAKKGDEEHPHPNSLLDLVVLPDCYTRTFSEGKFLIHDSGRDENNPNKRILVFATRSNLEHLCRSATWFLDGTFKVI